jgi:5-methylcytosine-specific restriction endonuclease McrA
MPASKQAKQSKWYREKRAIGCELCGRKIPTLENNGLEFSHIISLKDNGTNQQFNCLALCPTCSLAFDTVIKPALYRAFTGLNIQEIPLSWKNGEGRLKEKENEAIL